MGIPLGSRLEPTPDAPRVGLVVEPGEVGVDERPSAFTGSQREGHRASQIRLEPWPDGPL